MGNCICCPCWSKEKANAVETPHLSKRGGSCELRLRNEGRKKMSREAWKILKVQSKAKTGGRNTAAGRDGGPYGRRPPRTEWGWTEVENWLNSPSSFVSNAVQCLKFVSLSNEASYILHKACALILIWALSIKIKHKDAGMRSWTFVQPTVVRGVVLYTGHWAAAGWADISTCTHQAPAAAHCPVTGDWSSEEKG